jgi:hypothetical protein
MGIVIVVVCVGTGINLALWGALYAKLDGLPLRIWSMAKKERTDGEGAALTLSQERTAAKVGAIVKSLREYEEHVAASFRAQVAEAQVRARIAERQSSEAGVALSAASALVRDLRGLVDSERGLHRSTLRSLSASGDDAPITPPSTRAGDDGRRTSSRPPPPVQCLGGEVASPERLSGEDELTCVSPRRLAGVPENAGPRLVPPAGGSGRAR